MSLWTTGFSIFTALVNRTSENPSLPRKSMADKRTSEEVLLFYGSYYLLDRPGICLAGIDTGLRISKGNVCRELILGSWHSIKRE